jgi:hypothetical protein
MATYGQGLPPGPPPLPPKKTNPIVWILAGLFGLIVLAGIVMIAGGLFIAKKVHDASGNPALATAKLLAMANPDMEILSSDDSKGTVTIKDKKTGKVITMNFDQLSKGKIEFEEEDGKKVTMDASGEGLDIRGSDGADVQIGTHASAKLPDWLPAYPGATAQSAFSMHGENESGASVNFTTTDSVEKISKYYQDAFKAAGLTVNANTMSQDGRTAGGMITGESADQRRSAVVNIASGDDGVTVGITYSDKK